MSANKEGYTGCQFFITMQEMPCLNESDHTIIGRLVQGKETLGVIEGLEEYRSSQEEIKLRTLSQPASLGSIVNDPIVDRLKNMKQTKAVERINQK